MNNVTELFPKRRGPRHPRDLHVETIKMHAARCLAWLTLKERGPLKIYPTALELALDYGKNGTWNFFPLSLMVKALNDDLLASRKNTDDPRFNEHIMQPILNFDVDKFCEERYAWE